MMKATGSFPLIGRARAGLLAGLAALALAVAGCAGAAGQSPSAPSSATGSAAPATSGASSRAAPGKSPAAKVTGRLVLPSRTMAAGSEMSATVIVDNDSGHAISVIGCGGIFGVALISPAYGQSVVWPACRQRIVIPAGESSYKVPVTATYSECSSSASRGAPPSVQSCLPGDKPPPLPVGDYQATLEQSTRIFADPAPITVHVT